MKHKPTKYWKARADRLFSLWIRQRDADGNGVCRCITCNTPHSWRSIHAGHFISRGKENTRYNEKNVHAQCVSCNSFGEGMQYEYGKAIDRKYGEGTADQMVIRSKYKNKRSWFEYELIGNIFLEKLKANKFEIR